MVAGNTGDLKSLIRQAIPQKRDNPPMTPDGWIRMSSLAGLCAREEVLCARHGVVRQDDVGADLMMIFEHGHGLHWALQNRVLPKTQTLVGRWVCNTCGAAHGGREEWVLPREDEGFRAAQVLRPERCSYCGAELDSDTSLYQEQLVIEPQLRMNGHPDGFLLPADDMGIFEAKSISPRGAWEVRNCPKLDHVTQMQGYMWITGCRWGVLLYWDKGATGMAGLIEHRVEYDEEHVDAIKALVEDIRSGLRGGKLPERICGSPDCKRANLCSVVKPCFGKRG